MTVQDQATRFASYQQPFRRRLLQVSRQQAIELIGRVPSLGRRLDRPRTQPLKSSHLRLRKWRARPYGTFGKPESLGQIPWDYIDEQKDSIPFYGLREYWYPAVAATQLRHNETLAISLLGDALVLFRDKEGKPSVLEDRCPHRGPLLSLGMVGAWEPGTITCRYHGMTFDGNGTCVAFLADGPDSRACGRVKAKTYPSEELGGVVWVYMGEREPPRLTDWLPYCEEVFAPGHPIKVFSVQNPVSHLHTLDNSMDLAHPAILHRTCVVFGDQKLGGATEVVELPNGGMHIRYVDDMPHPGRLHVDELEWHLPNFIVQRLSIGPTNAEGIGYHWFVPNDVAMTTDFFIIRQPKLPPIASQLFRGMFRILWGEDVRWPGSAQSCVNDADMVMMLASGRVPVWTDDHLTQTDRGIVKIRRRLKAAHAVEVAERAASSEKSTPVPSAKG